PLGLGDSIQPAALEPTEKRRVVDGRVNSSERIKRRARHVQCRCCARHVQLSGNRRTVFCLQELERLRAVVDIRDHHPSAVACEISGIFLANATRSARDDDDFPLDLHACPLSMRRLDAELMSNRCNLVALFLGCSRELGGPADVEYLSGGDEALPNHPVGCNDPANITAHPLAKLLPHTRPPQQPPPTT